MDSLATLVMQTLAADPFTGNVFIFRSKRSDRLKLSAWGGSGLYLITKRLESGGFIWPPTRDGAVTLSTLQLPLLSVSAWRRCRPNKAAAAPSKTWRSVRLVRYSSPIASDVSALPREPDILIEMVLELRRENGKLRAMLEALRRTPYGARSERFDSDPGQLALGLEDVSTEPVEPEPESANPRSQYGRIRPKPVRNIGGLPKHLPREDVVIGPAIEHCPCCQGTLH